MNKKMNWQTTTINARAKLLFIRSKWIVERIKMRCCTSLYLKNCLRYGQKCECINFAIFAILYRKFVNSYKKLKIEKSVFLWFLVYLWSYLSYRDTQYLIFILSTIHFDLMNSNFALAFIVFELYGQTFI